MAKPKLYITEQRMLKIIEYAVAAGIADNRSEFLDKIGNSRYNYQNIISGKQGFTKEQILSACKLTGSSADYVFGFTNIMEMKEQKNPIDVLKRAVFALDGKSRKC